MPNCSCLNLRGEGRIMDKIDFQRRYEDCLGLFREHGGETWRLSSGRCGRWATRSSRAAFWAALAVDGRVILVRGPWNQDFIQEAANFPNSSHDDQIDAVSIAVKMLSQTSRRAYGF